MKFVGTIATNLSGSLAGLTASRARGGINYFRARSAPTNPASARQDVIRSAVATLTAMWSQLGLSDWISWRVFASNVLKTDGLGQEYTAPGISWFVGANVGRIQAGQSIVTAAPNVYTRAEQPVPEGSAMDLGTSEGSISGTFEGPADDDGFVAVYIGRPTNAGVEFYDGPWRFVGIASFDAAAQTWELNIDAGTDAEGVYAGPYGAIAAGDAVRLRLVTYYDDGRYSSGVQSLVTVGTI